MGFGSAAEWRHGTLSQGEARRIVLLRGVLIVSAYFLLDWALGSFAFLRREGLPRTVRRVLSLALAVCAASGVPTVH